MKIGKVIIVLLVFSLVVLGCKDTSDDIHNLKLSSREIFNENDEIVKVHADFLSSEYIEVKYSGDKLFNLDFQVWENGKLIETIPRIIDIDLSKVKGISLDINLYNDEEYNSVIGIYSKEGCISSSEGKLPKPKVMLAGRVESTIKKEKKFLDSEDIGLWGFHYFDKDFRSFEDSFEAAKDMEWSIVAVLRPVE